MNEKANNNGVEWRDGVWVGGNISQMDALPDEIKQEMLKLRLPPHGYSAKKLAKWLFDNHQRKISAAGIWRWIQRNESIATTSVYSDKDFKRGVNKVYSEVLGEYFTCLKHIIRLEKKVCTYDKNKIELKAQSDLAIDLFNTIKEGTVTAKDLVVGKGGTETHMLDLTKEVDRFQEMPIIQILNKDIKDEEPEKPDQ